MYDARLTAAGFLGDVEITRQGGLLAVSGLRAPSSWIRARVLIQWSLAGLAIAGVVLQIEWAFLGLPAALAFSFASYLALWWIAEPDSAVVLIGRHTNAAVGPVLSLWDLLWLGNFLTAAILLSSKSTSGRCLVSFEGPGSEPDRIAKYRLMAPDPGEAALLAATLMDMVPAADRGSV